MCVVPAQTAPAKAIKPFRPIAILQSNAARGFRYTNFSAHVFLFFGKFYIEVATRAAGPSCPTLFHLLATLVWGVHIPQPQAFENERKWHRKSRIIFVAIRFFFLKIRCCAEC